MFMDQNKSKQAIWQQMLVKIYIFENQYKNKIPLTIVKPGSQSRKFTHITDTIEKIKICYEAWKKINAPTTVFHTKNHIQF